MLKLTCICVLLTALSACDVPDKPYVDTQDKNKKTLSEKQLLANDMKELIHGNNNFAFTLYSHLQDHGRINLLFSPYSIYSALSLTALGAERETWQQMSRTLNWPYDHQKLAHNLNALNETIQKNDTKENTLHLVNALWAQNNYPLLPQFVKSIKENKLGNIFSIDFSQDPVTKINDWIKKETQGQVKELLSESDISELTSLVLTNSLYLKAAWQYLFDIKDTRNSPFFLDAKQAILVPMMHQTNFFNLFYDDTLTFLEIPYSNHSLSLYILMPKEIDDFSLIQSKLNLPSIEKLQRKLKPKYATLSIPRFKDSLAHDFKPILVDLNMNIPFAPGEADFSLIDGNLNLYLSHVMHSTWISVNEQGTEAASATAAVMNMKSIRTPPQDISINQPFIFFIQDNDTKTILFLGHIMNPLSEVKPS